METLRNPTQIAIYDAGSFCLQQEYHNIAIPGYVIRVMPEKNNGHL